MTLKRTLKKLSKLHKKFDEKAIGLLINIQNTYFLTKFMYINDNDELSNFCEEIKIPIHTPVFVEGFHVLNHFKKDSVIH